MKRIDRNSKKIVIIILAFIFAFPSICFAMDGNETNMLPLQINVPTDKIWTVTFNEVVDIKTITKDNIFIKDSKGYETDSKLEINEDEKSVKLIHSAKYLQGEKYTIYIKNLIKNKAGNKVLKKNLQMDFVVTTKVTDLPVVGSEAKLRELMETAGRYYNVAYMQKDGMSQPMVEIAPGEMNYLSTNVQVNGVDEGDNVKTDGENIYRINKQSVEIIKAYPVGEMKILKTIDFNSGEDSFYPNEIYVDDKHMVVIGNYNIRRPMLKIEDSEAEQIIHMKDSAKMSLPFLWKNTVRVMVYDISDINNIKHIRKVEVDGNIMATRKIGDMLYLVSNQYINYYSEKISDMLPGYVDSAISEEYKNVDYKDIHYFKDSVQANYLMLTNINLGNMKEAATIYTCLGGSDNIFMSKENLYISAYDNNRYINYGLMPESISEVDRTNIYKFQLKNGKFEFMASGKVNGTVLNQFSMDENNNYFRVATTTNAAWNASGDATTKNNVYILDKELELSGKLENLAKGERIYSVRFMGDKGYVVTFKNIDPLFVIDLKDVNSPTVLGQLKIPGYSSYLHPYDENHIIGIGKDTVEVDGRVTEKGIKLSLFDVTDYTNPKEKFSTVIGDTGSYSEVLNNHKALLFSKNKNLLAFPISVMKNVEDVNSKWIYAKEIFQGAYVYNVDLLNGFELRGRLTHLSPGDLEDSYENIYDRNIQRILYINDVLYTISNDTIMANDFNDLSIKNKISRNK